MAVDEVAELEHHARAAGDGHVAPGLERGAGGLDGGVDVLGPGLERLPEPLWDVDAARFGVMLNRISLSADLPEEIDYRHDAVTVGAMVRKGLADAAVLLRPVSVQQIDTVAEAGLRMPPKTTFFQPKPLTGLVFRSLDLG